MKYNFDEIIDRSGTNSLKWDVAGNALPMWVADMDFKACPVIIQALDKRVDNGVFGYSIIPDEWYDAYCGWWHKRHGFEIQHDWLVFCTGVIPAISSLVRKLTMPSDNVVIQTPVYNIFFNSIINNGRKVLENKLLYDGVSYKIDFEDLEEKLAGENTTMLILCNPQNPAGIIWSRETLSRIGDLCLKYHVTVVSDEIHCDITDIGKEYVPFASVSEACRINSVTCLAPTKAFNIAGLNTAAVMVPNEELRKKAERGLNTDECAEPNAFAVQAAVAAFNYGGEWLDELRYYVEVNKKLVTDFIATELPKVKGLASEATYLIWLDCSAYRINSEAIQEHLKTKAGLLLSAGSIYGGNGSGFLRMNVACPKSVVVEGLKRLKDGLETLGK